MSLDVTQHTSFPCHTAHKATDGCSLKNLIPTLEDLYLRWTICTNTHLTRSNQPRSTRTCPSSLLVSHRLSLQQRLCATWGQAARWAWDICGLRCYLMCSSREINLWKSSYYFHCWLEPSWFCLHPPSLGNWASQNMDFWPRAELKGCASDAEAPARPTLGHVCVPWAGADAHSPVPPTELNAASSTTMASSIPSQHTWITLLPSGFTQLSMGSKLDLPDHRASAHIRTGAGKKKISSVLNLESLSTFIYF